MLYHIQLPEPSVSPLNVIWYVFHIVQVVLTFVSFHSLKFNKSFESFPQTHLVQSYVFIFIIKNYK
jgi:hypothetical protein